jgi:hypothetical protein
MHAEAVRKAVRKFVSVHGHPPEGYAADGSPKGGAAAPSSTEAHASVGGTPPPKTLTPAQKELYRKQLGLAGPEHKAAGQREPNEIPNIGTLGGYPG